MEPPFQNDYIFGNSLLEAIPHPDGILGSILYGLSVAAHFSGGPNFFTLFMPFILYFYSMRFGWKLMIAICSTGVFNGLAKFYFQSPRPHHLSQTFDQFQSQVHEGSFGLPSGHTQVSLGVWLLVFFEFKNIYIRSFALFMAVFTPFSRMYAGVHYPGDILGGAILAGITLLIIHYIFLDNNEFPDVNSWKNSPVPARSRIFSLTAVCIAPILLQNQNLTKAHIESLAQVVSGAGAFAGFFAGYVILKQKFEENFSNEIFRNDYIKTILFFLPAAFIHFGLSYLGKKYFHDDMLFRFSRYWLIGFYLSFIPPYFVLRYKRQ